MRPHPPSRSFIRGYCFPPPRAIRRIPHCPHTLFRRHHIHGCRHSLCLCGEFLACEYSPPERSPRSNHRGYGTGGTGFFQRYFSGLRRVGGYGQRSHHKIYPDLRSYDCKNGQDKEASVSIDAETITHTVDKSEVKQTADKVVQKVNSTTISVADNKVALGDENATEPLVLGNELAQLMLDFMTECSKVMTPTLMGTMSPINFPNFISLTSRIQKFLSKTSYTK